MSEKQSLTRDQDVREQRQKQQQVVGQIPETVDDFLRNFLLRLGLVRTLDHFQREWYQIDRGFVPDALTQRSLIQSELEQERAEAGLLRRQVLDLSRTLVVLQHERDFYREVSSKVEDQKRALRDDLTRLSEHRGRLDSTLTALTRGHETALRTRTLTQIQSRTRAEIQEEDVRETLIQTESRQSETGRGQTTDHHNGKLSQSLRSSVRTGRPSGPDKEKNETKLQQNQQSCTKEETHETGPAHFTLTCPVRAHHQPISNIEVHPIRRLLATSSDDRSWRLWALPTEPEPVAALLLSGEGHSDWLTSCSFSPDGDKLATTSGDSTVRVWDLGRGLCLLSLRGHLSATWGCSFSRSGRSLASASSDRTVRLWDAATGRSLAVLRRHGNVVSSVRYLPSRDHLLLSSSRDRTLLLWDERVNTCAAAITGHAHPVEHCTVDTTGRVAASCDAGGDVKLWDMRSLRSALFSFSTSPSGANQVSLCPAGTGSEEVVVAGGDGLVRLLRPSSGHVTEVGGHQGAVCSVCFDHQGETLLSAGADGVVQVWRRTQ